MAARAIGVAALVGSMAAVVALAVARRRRNGCARRFRRSSTAGARAGDVDGEGDKGEAVHFALPTTAPPAPAIHGSPGLALTRQTVEIISSSVPVIGSAEAASIFYTELFSIAPDLKGLFGSQQAQQRKLRGILNWVSSVLTDIPNLSDGLRALGERHLKYNAKLEHFHAVKCAFMQMVSIVDQQSINADQEGFDEVYDDGDGGSEGGRGSSQAPVLDRHQRLLDVSRAWEALLYVFIGEMSPKMLMHDTIGSFHNALSNDLAAPAGGTCLALAGAQGACLLMMAARVTRAHSTSMAQREVVEGAGKQLLQAKTALEMLAQLDMSAYCRVMAAIRQPALQYPIARLRAISASLESAAMVPLQIAEWAVYALHVARALLPIANVSGVGDAGAGSYLLLAAGRAAIDNVSVNTGSKLAAHGWRGWARAIDARAKELLAELDEIESEVKCIQRARNPRDG